MKRMYLMITLIFVALLFGCAVEKERHHEDSLPDPASFNAHFPHIDANADGLVDWPEFAHYFPHADTYVFRALDLNMDRVIDHREWHEFKRAHGLGHQ